MTEPMQTHLFEPVLPAGAAVPPVGKKAVPPARKSLSAVGQTAVLPYKKHLVGQQADSLVQAKASPPSLALGGTPLPETGEAESVTSPDKKQTRSRKPRVPPAGRSYGGAACVGCLHFTVNLKSTHGTCATLKRPVAGTARHPCGAYQIWHITREAAA